MTNLTGLHGPLSTLLFLSLVIHNSNGLNSGTSSSSSSSSSSTSKWQPLPDLWGRREALTSTATAAAATATAVGTTFQPQPSYATTASAATKIQSAINNNVRSVATINSHMAIPVWPTWGGGRVVPVSLGGGGGGGEGGEPGGNDDPFLLLAHHKHWFDPRDPLRKPFKAFGKALGLPYVDVEGFSMHPHRGLDIFTYVLDGSDGFCHRDSLSDSERVYRGGCAQWMRTGAGVEHEEFWETRDDRRTNIELFQIWVNLPAIQKFDPPVVRYVGTATEYPWVEETLPSGVHVRDVSGSLEASFLANNDEEVRKRPPIQIQHVRIPSGATWNAHVPEGYSAVIYVREGTATIDNENENDNLVVKALQTATFYDRGDTIKLKNDTRKQTLDLLLMAGKPLNEPVVLGGPIVMNTQPEIYDAYRQLSDGTFLDRDIALKQQAATRRRYGY